MSAIVWILIIISPSGYCMAYPRITFATETECVKALASLDEHHRNFSKCEPAKKESKP